MTEMSEAVAKWCVADEFYDVPEINMGRYATVFHRKLYTFGVNGEVYIKFSKLNRNLKSLDDVILMDTKSCNLRVSENEYIIVVGDKDSDDIAVVGVLSKRYLDKNNFNQYGVKISDITKCNLVSIDKFKEARGVMDFEKHFQAAQGRLKSGWKEYKTETDNASSSNRS
ncbi:hypothetical protein JCM33374_g3406 [Metschnikowia sp. JCM 33374]|nr:hypothetical protein JCM33374_g3406 [Metschnikowia sp. JCM 33374]